MSYNLTVWQIQSILLEKGFSDPGKHAINAVTSLEPLDGDTRWLIFELGVLNVLA
jgi:hypothetical protein